MRSKFPGFYRPKPEICAQKFKECVFSFDTNVLLNLYRYTPESRDNLIKFYRP
jgi:PIN like domain